MNLHSRLNRLERRRPHDGVQIIHVLGGLPGDDRLHATIGDTQLARDEGESLADFEARATTAARAGHAQFAIIGGLPA